MPEASLIWAREAATSTWPLWRSWRWAAPATAESTSEASRTWHSAAWDCPPAAPSRPSTWAAWPSWPRGAWTYLPEVAISPPAAATWIRAAWVRLRWGVWRFRSGVWLCRLSVVRRRSGPRGMRGAPGVPTWVVRTSVVWWISGAWRTWVRVARGASIPVAATPVVASWFRVVAIWIWAASRTSRWGAWIRVVRTRGVLRSGSGQLG